MKVYSWVCGAIFQYEDYIRPSMTRGTSFKTFQIDHVKAQVVSLSLSFLVSNCEQKIETVS